MKILSIQGHFGNLGGRKIEFSEGFCRSVLPNGWGKSTLFALIRIMLYGLNPAKQDTATELSDKTRYLPQDGKGMYGRLTVKHDGRVIVIERTSGKNGPMQDFHAYDRDTGETCTLFDAKNCGQVLTGLSEDAFLSSMMIDGSAMQRPSEELREHIASLTQTGDTQGQAQHALQTLTRWKSEIEGTEGQSVLARLEKAQAALDARADRSTQLLREWEKQEADNAHLEEAVQEAHAAYERIYRAYAGTVASEEEHLEALVAQSDRMVAHLEACTPSEESLQTAVDALYQYERAVKLEREKRERLPQQGSRYDQALDKLEQEREEDEIARNEAARPRVRWWALLMGLLFAVASAATEIFRVEWGVFTPYARYILSGLAVIGVIVAFAGSVRKYEHPKRDFEAERAALEKARQAERAEQKAAAEALQGACDALMHAAQKLDPQVRTTEQAAIQIRDAQENQQALRRERGARAELLERQKKLRLGLEQTHEQTQQVLQAREKLADLQKQLDAGRQTAARLKGQAAALDGTGEDALSWESVTQAKQEAQCQLDAIALALSVTSAEQDAMTARISPQITRLTQEYLQDMTAGEYKEVRLSGALDASCAGEDGRMQGALQLSTGTRDQLYFALRLAVCNVLGKTEEAAPILLDDPFLTFDDDRAARALALLRRLAKDRQIILLTCRRTYPLQQQASAT